MEIFALVSLCLFGVIFITFVLYFVQTVRNCNEKRKMFFWPLWVSSPKLFNKQGNHYRKITLILYALLLATAISTLVSVNIATEEDCPNIDELLNQRWVLDHYGSLFASLLSQSTETFNIDAQFELIADNRFIITGNVGGHTYTGVCEIDCSHLRIADLVLSGDPSTEQTNSEIERQYLPHLADATSFSILPSALMINYGPQNLFESLYFEAMKPEPVMPGSTTSPGPAITTLTPTFQWTEVTSAVSYELSIRDMASKAVVFDSQAKEISIKTTSFDLPSGVLTWGEPYRWCVRSYNRDGSGSHYSDPLYFQTQSH